MIHRETDPITKPWRWRYLPAASLCVFFVCISILFLLGNTQAYSAILWQLGVDPFAFPFLDAHGVLSTAECHRYGIDVLVENPCDVLGRTLDYSPFWLLTAKLGLATSWTRFAGLGLDLLFLFWLFFLPTPRGWPEAIVLILALFSSMVALALERANLDLAIFVIAIVGVHWAMRNTIWRVLSYALIMLGALVKYYPGVLLVLAIRERLSLLAALALATIGVTTYFVISEGNDLFRALSQIEVGPWLTFSFGAQNLSRGIGAMAGHFHFDPRFAAVSAELALAVAAVLGAVTIASLEDLQESLDLLPEQTRVFLLAGCALIVACFFAAQNAPYRGIYFLFILPGITTLWRAPLSRAARHRFMLTGICILFLMWSQVLERVQMEILGGLDAPKNIAIVTHIGFWLLREIVWWWLISILLALLLCLIYRSQSGQQLLRLFLSAERLAALQLQGGRHRAAEQRANRI
jgi:hypothetical protein